MIKFILAFIFVFSVVILTACGSFNTSESFHRTAGERQVFTPVEDWTPLVQGTTAGAGTWRIESHTRVNPPERPDDFDWDDSDANIDFFEESMAFFHGEETARLMARNIRNSSSIWSFFFYNYNYGTDLRIAITPSYFAGEVHYDESMVVHIVDIPEAAEFLLFLEDLEGVNVNFVEFSRNELMELVDYIWNAFRYHAPLFDNFSSWFDVESNRVIVTMWGNFGDEAIELFRQNIIDSPLVIFIDPNLIW
ncbi:MAG: hypothetical protein FWE05_08395 [Defluviitaleaceae bacterium]|nr:hypothetical protein [Defluviitaleaceae bacterium]